MKIIIVYNKHRHGGGSDVVAQKTVELLSNQTDCTVYSFVRDSNELQGIGGRIKALLSGLYAFEAVKTFAQMLDDVKPDIVHAHEIYPLISPWIFKKCKEKGVPVVMTCHDYRLSCPIATHFSNGDICYECPEHGESRCIRNNCCGSFFKSVAYAARNYIGRSKRLFLDNVDLFLTPSTKAKEILCGNSMIGKDLVVAVGNPVVRTMVRPPPQVDNSNSASHEETEVGASVEYSLLGDYVGYVGRVEPEKGFDLLLKALGGSKIPLKVVGDFSSYIPREKKCLENIEFIGCLHQSELRAFYAGARLIVAPSLCHETFGLVVAESLSHGTPVVISDLGALAEVAGPGGLVFPGSNIEALRDSISKLWNDQALCRSMGEAGRKHVEQYSEASYVENLMQVYEQVLFRKSHELSSI